MGRWPADNQADLIRFYGDPGTGEVAAQLIRVVPPFQMYYDKELIDDSGKKYIKTVPIHALSFHRKAAPALLAALNEIWEHYGRDQSKIDAIGISKCEGTYNLRKVRGSDTKWSNHAYGAAIDLNAAENGFNAVSTIPQPVIDAFKRQGARWGGDYHGRKDPMHFEFCDAGAPPVALVDMPQGDVDTPEVQDEPAAADDAKPSLFKRIRNHILGWGSGGASLGFLGYMTSWQVVVVLCAFALLAGALVTGFVLWFFGADNVRAWVRKQVGSA